jgi:hypothetical protein
MLSDITYKACLDNWSALKSHEIEQELLRKKKDDKNMAEAARS